MSDEKIKLDPAKMIEKLSFAKFAWERNMLPLAKSPEERAVTLGIVQYLSDELEYFANKFDERTEK